MRTSSKILVFLFFIVAAGLIYLVNKADEREIEEAVAERLARQQVAQEQAVADRMAALDSAIARVEMPIYYRIKADEVEEVLKRIGLGYERVTEEDGDPRFSFKLATYLTHIYFYACEEEGCQSIRIGTCFEMSNPPSIDTIAEWNRAKRFSTAYRNNDGNTCLDNDLVFTGGTTEGALENFVYNFRDRLSEYAAHIDF